MVNTFINVLVYPFQRSVGKLAVHTLIIVNRVVQDNLHAARLFVADPVRGSGLPLGYGITPTHIHIELLAGDMHAHDSVPRLNQIRNSRILPPMAESLS
jgi:hypothetical protein